MLMRLVIISTYSWVIAWCPRIDTGFQECSYHPLCWLTQRHFMKVQGQRIRTCPKVPSTGSMWVVDEKQGLKRTEPEAHLRKRSSNYSRQFSSHWHLPSFFRTLYDYRGTKAEGKLLNRFRWRKCLQKYSIGPMGCFSHSDPLTWTNSCPIL